MRVCFKVVQGKLIKPAITNLHVEIKLENHRSLSYISRTAKYESDALQRIGNYLSPNQANIFCNAFITAISFMYYKCRYFQADSSSQKYKKLTASAE